MAASSESSCELNLPKLNLMDDSASFNVSPMARSACEGSVKPLAQAAPVDDARRGFAALSARRAEFDFPPRFTYHIPDTPIKTVNGKSVARLRDKNKKVGDAVIKWTLPSDFTEVAIRYRKLGNNSSGVPHSSHEWTLAGSLPNAHEQKITRYPLNFNQRMRSSNLFELTLTNRFYLEEVYAIQLNYKTSAGWTYSARDAYVWPSTRAADGGERVASFPLTQRGKTYSYRICEDTFPKPDPNNMWEKAIKHAFGQWGIATDGLVSTVHLSNQDCADYADFIVEVEKAVREDYGAPFPQSETDNVKKLIQDLLDMYSNAGLKNYNNAIKDYSDVAESDSVGNDIRMFNDEDPFLKELMNKELLSEIGDGVGYGCGKLKDARACAVSVPTGSGVTITDILLKRTEVEPDAGKTLGIPGMRRWDLQRLPAARRLTAQRLESIRCASA